MNKYLYILIIFLFVAFVYIHVLFHLKVNNLLEIQSIEITGKEDFEEQCNNRLPFIFHFQNNSFQQEFSQTNLQEKYKSFDLYNITTNSETSLKDIVNEEHFISYNNHSFLEESDLVNILNKEDSFLRPTFTCYKDYDLLCGKSISSNFKSSLFFRNFLYVVDGELELYLCPPKSTKFLNYNYNYNNFENETYMNPFEEETQKSIAFDKIKPEKVVLKKGQAIFLPSSWYYSYKMNDITNVICFKYRTFMNMIALTPNYINYVYKRINEDKNIVN